MYTRSRMSDVPHIVVVGSSNVDMVARAPRLPEPGETVLGESFVMSPGGKGANQAVAAARLGARVTFVGRLGADVFGDSAANALAAEGIDISFVARDQDASTGIALIGVSAAAENSIIVVPGANDRLSPQDVEAASEAIASADIVVCQLESPIETVHRAFQIARAAGVRTLLNPALAHHLPRELLTLTSILTPNQSEAALLAGGAPEEAASTLRASGIDTVIVTLGHRGAYVDSVDWAGMSPAWTVGDVVDTTGAGDCFSAALAAALAEGLPLLGAVSFANSAAGLSVTKPGAQSSMPRRDEVFAFAGRPAPNPAATGLPRC